jgi:acetyl-CoA synthetase
MQGLQECLVAVKAAAHIGRRQRNAKDVRGVIARELVRGDAVVLDEWQSKQLLAKSGLPIPHGRLATENNASDIAVEIGFPVVVKAVGVNIQHKTELNAVRLNLANTQEVSDAVTGLRQHSQQFLIEKMLDGAVAELIVGVTRHGQFGLVMIIGSGGVLTELVQDTVTLLLPVARNEVKTAMEKLRVMKLLNGYRSKLTGDIEACIDAIMSIATFAQANADRLLELDVNPLLVLPERRGAVAADALLRMIDNSE